ncbi:MAG: hypothetical protein ABW173_06325 [Sphingomonas sp.]
MTTALHASSSPNERLMALAAFGRAMEKAGVHPSDIAVVPAASATPPEDRTATQAAMRRETENVALARRVKAQEKALREAGREADAFRRRITEMEQTLAERDAAVADLACQVDALEADIAARDRRIGALENGTR